jgi:TPR repeat protein
VTYLGHDEPETADEISIGHMYEYGEVLPQDYSTALHWYQLAASTRNTAAEAGVQRVEQLLSGLSPLRESEK